MKTPAERLVSARIDAGYHSAAEAARAMGMRASTYAAYENGQNGFARTADRLARFFRCDLDWLLTGRGEMRGRRITIPLMGVVTAGSSIIPITSSEADTPLDEIQLPERGKIAALIVKGESMYPRFLDGETLLYDPTPVRPDALINRYAVVQTLDGRLMIKKLKASPKNNRFVLWSHNAPDEEVELLTAHKFLGMLA